MMRLTRVHRGFVLLPVTLLLAVIAATAWLMSREGAAGADRVTRGAEGHRARYAAEAGLAHAAWAANASGACSGYALPTTAFGADSYGATFTPASGSPVTIAASGTLASGVARTLSRTGVPVYQPVQTLALQPDAAAGKDTWLYEWKPTWNYGMSPDVYVSNRFAYSWSNGLLQFDLAGVSAGAAVISATLELRQRASSAWGGSVAVRAVTGDWTEGVKTGALGAPNWTERDAGTNWSTAGGDLDPAAVATTSIPVGTVGWFQWDVTALAQAWVSGTRVNRGLALVPVAAGTDVTFDSSDTGTAANRPKLTVIYACECGKVCGAQTTAVAAPGAGSDDAEQRADTTMYLDSSDLELTEDGGVQTVGIRFPGLGVPAGAQIVSAVVEFTVDETGADPTSVTFHGEAADSAAAFGTANGDITARTQTAASVDWNTIPAWDTVGQTWTSPDMKSIVQEIVNRPGWAGGNALALVITGTGRRTAEAFEGDPMRAPVLRVVYGGGTGPAYPEAYVDLFEADTCNAATDYANSDGTLDWTGAAWAESGDTGGDPCAGALRLAADGDDRSARLSGAGNALARAASLFGATRATLRLDYRRQDLDDAGDYLVVEVRGNGAGWTEVGRFAGPGTDAGYRPFSADILTFAAADTAVRLRTVALAGSGPDEDIVYVDNLRIDTDGGPAPACAATLADDFASGGYAGSSGTIAWAPPWAEIGESNGAGNGDVTVGSFGGSQALGVANKDMGAWRGANLSAYASAVLEVDYRRDSLDKPSESVTVEVSGNGGGSWATVATLAGAATDTAWQTLSVDVSAYRGADTRVRFVSSGQMGGGDAVYFNRVVMCLN